MRTRPEYTIAFVDDADPFRGVILKVCKPGGRFTEVPAEMDCPECDGTGMTERDRGDGICYQCPTCHGWGEICSRCSLSTSDREQDAPRCACPLRLAQRETDRVLAAEHAATPHGKPCATCDRADAAEERALAAQGRMA